MAAMPCRCPRRTSAVVMVVLSCLAGCGDAAPPRAPVHPVTGKVLVNGRPAEKAMVVFHPLGTADPRALKPLGTVGADGTYRLTSYLTGDGAPEGEYAVTVVWPGGPPPKAPDDLPPDRPQGRYADP